MSTSGSRAWRRCPSSELRPELERHAWGYDPDDPDAVVDCFFGQIEVYAKDSVATREALAEFFGDGAEEGDLSEAERAEVVRRLRELGPIDPIDQPEPLLPFEELDQVGWLVPGGVEVSVSLLTGRTSISVSPYAAVTECDMARAWLRFARARSTVAKALGWVASTRPL